MSIASELTNLEGNIEDSYDAVNDMGGIIPAQRNMDNLDQAIRTIPQNTGTTYTAGYGIDIDANNEISIDDTVVAELTDIPGVMIGATSSAPGVGGTVPAPAAGDESKVLSGAGTWVAQTAAQVNSDWNANSGVAQILNKPSLATVATSGDYGDLLNKPTIPTVNDATLTIQHNGTNVQTFTANASSNVTANIETIYADTITPTTAVATIGTTQIAGHAVTPAKLSDTGWVQVDFCVNTTYFAIRSSGDFDGHIYYRVLGGVVYWRGAIYCHTAPNAEQAEIMSNIPAEAMPASEHAVYGSLHYVNNSDYSLWLETVNNVGHAEVHQIDQNIPVASQDWQCYSLSQINYISKDY